MTEKIHLNGNQLKMIALVTMLIDHVGYFLFPELRILRIIGRFSFPIYCYLLVEGARYTRDIRRYGMRLFIFALISEVGFNLCSSNRYFDLSTQNVFWTLLLGLVMIWLMRQSFRFPQIPEVVYVLAVVGIIGGMAELCNTDYGIVGIAMIFYFYVVYESDAGMMQKILLFFLLNLCRGKLQIFGVLALIPISLYNGERGRQSKLLKFAFYAFYPVHMYIGALIGMALHL